MCARKKKNHTLVRIKWLRSPGPNFPFRDTKSIKKETCHCPLWSFPADKLLSSLQPTCQEPGSRRHLPAHLLPWCLCLGKTKTPLGLAAGNSALQMWRDDMVITNSDKPEPRPLTVSQGLLAWLQPLAQANGKLCATLFEGRQGY